MVWKGEEREGEGQLEGELSRVCSGLSLLRVAVGPRWLGGGALFGGAGGVTC